MALRDVVFGRTYGVFASKILIVSQFFPSFDIEL